MTHYVLQLGKLGYTFWIDLDGYKNPEELFQSSRPDMVIMLNLEMWIIELTCCFEKNPIKSRNYKENKYVRIENEILIPYSRCNKIYVEITNTGLVGKEIDHFLKMFQGTDINTSRMIQKIMEVAIRCSFYIYTRRNTTSNNPKLLTYH